MRGGACVLRGWIENNIEKKKKTILMPMPTSKKDGLYSRHGYYFFTGSQECDGVAEEHLQEKAESRGLN